MPGPDTPEELGALAVLEEATALLVNLVGWGAALGIGIIWAHTFGPIFQGIARALTFKISAGWGPSKTIHLGGWASSIDHAATEAFTTWAVDQEQAVGMWWYAIGWTVNQMVVQAQEMAATTARFAHWAIHTAIPSTVDATLKPWLSKTNKTAAAAGAAGALAALLKKALSAEHQAEHAASQATRAATRAAGHEAHVAHSVATTTANTVTHETKVITQVVDVYHLPIPFGRTVAQLKKRLGLLEAATGATAAAIAMANVFGLPNWRCLTRGNVGRLMRHVCGVPSWLIDLLIVGTVEAFIASDLCGFSDLLIEQAEAIRPALMELVDVEDALIGCNGTTKPLVFNLPAASLPPLQGVSPLAA